MSYDFYRIVVLFTMKTIRQMSRAVSTAAMDGMDRTSGRDGEKINQRLQISETVMDKCRRKHQHITEAPLFERFRKPYGGSPPQTSGG